MKKQTKVISAESEVLRLQAEVERLQNRLSVTEILLATEKRQGFYHFTKRGEAERKVARLQKALNKASGTIKPKRKKLTGSQTIRATLAMERAMEILPSYNR